MAKKNAKEKNKSKSKGGSKQSKQPKVKVAASSKKTPKIDKSLKKSAKKVPKLKDELFSLQLQKHFQLAENEFGTLKFRDGTEHQVGSVRLIEDKVGAFILGTYLSGFEAGNTVLAPLSELVSLVIATAEVELDVTDTGQTTNQDADFPETGSEAH